MPHDVVTVYIIVSTPAVTPVTTPPLDTVALPNVVLQVPPDTVDDKVMVLPVHTVVGPDMVPAHTPLVTVTTAVENAVPQLDVTE